MFRTYNASITLDTLLAEPSPEETVEGRKAEYDRANKEVSPGCFVKGSRRHCASWERSGNVRKAE